MRSDAMHQLRIVLKAFCPKGTETVTVPQLGAALGLTTEIQQQVLRRRMTGLIRRGEVKKAGRGLFQRVPGKEPSCRSNAYTYMWRAVRSHQTTFSVLGIVQITRVDSTTVRQYLGYLEEGGLIRRAGRDGNTRLYRTTQLLRDTTQTPFPPVDIPDPYQQERTATAALNTIMMTQDPDKPGTRRKIREQLDILLASFSQNEKEEVA